MDSVGVTDLGRLAALDLDQHIADEVERIAAALELGVSCLVTGSIVEGFGNANSDVDLYLVHQAAPSEAGAMGLRRSRYIDCEHMPIASLPALAARIIGASWSSIAEVRRQDLDRYYRLAIGLPVVLTPETEQVLRSFSRAEATATFGRWSLLRAYEYLARASCYFACGKHREADLLLRECVWWHSSSVLAAEGEGYPSAKWMAEKAARRHGRGSRRFDELVDDAICSSGDLTTRLDRQRSRVRIPEALNDVLQRRSCRLRPDVRLVSRGADQLLVRANSNVAAVQGIVAHVCQHLADGDSWATATERAAMELRLPTLEARVAAWSFMAPLRGIGFVEEQAG